MLCFPFFLTHYTSLIKRLYPLFLCFSSQSSIKSFISVSLLMNIFSYTPRISFIYLNNVTFSCIISYCLSIIAFCTIRSTLLLGLNAQSALASKSLTVPDQAAVQYRGHYRLLLWMIILVTLNL